MADSIDEDAPVTAAQAAVILADERVTRRTAPLSYWREHAFAAADGSLVFPAAGGVFRVTEANSLSLLASAQLIQASGEALVPTINGPVGIAGQIQYTKRRIGRATATTAAGAFANLALVPALAGYYGVCKIVGVIAQNAAAAGVLTFESPAGTGALPSVFVNAYLASVLNDELRDVVISHATLVDNQAIVVDGAAFGAGDVTVIYEYWYET